jgi:3-mercaptopyruvate sulfurtransferase SseA
MYFKQFLNERCGCASYVIASRKTHEAAIIDPAIETEPFEELLRDHPVFVICQGGFRSLRAAQFLSQRGYSDVASVKGGTEAWRTGGGEMILENSPATQPGFVETEWTRAGGGSYSI